MRRGLMLLCCSLLVGCMATGTKVTEEQLFALDKGVTTYFDVVTRLGKPNQSTLHSDGSREILYIYTQAQVNAINYVPFAAMFAQGQTSETTTAALLFDPRSILVGYTVTSGQTTMGYGFQSGAKQ